MNSDPDLNCTEGKPVRYWIDALDRLVEVNDAWNIFAVENGAAELTRDRVLGQPIWRYVSDQTTQELYRSLIAVARESKHIEFVYRCDTPALKRLMQMTIIPEDSRVVCFQSAVASVTVQKQLALWDPRPVRSGGAIRTCSWCKRLEIGGRWTELDTAVDVLGLFTEAPLPPVTQVTCPSCYESITLLAESTPKL